MHPRGTKKARSRPLPLRSHSGAKQQSGGVYSFLLPAHNLSSRSGRADFDRFFADFSQKTMIFCCKNSVTESTICINLFLLCNMERLFFWKAFACHRLPEILPGFELVGCLYDFCRDPYGIILSFGHAAGCLQHLFNGRLQHLANLAFILSP